MAVRAMIVMLLGSAVVVGGLVATVEGRKESGDGGAWGAPEPATITAEPARIESLELRLSAIAFLEARQGVEVSAPVDGTVQSIRFESGQQVAQGDVLVALDADVELAGLEGARAELELAEANLARAEALKSTDAVSVASLDKAAAEHRVWTATVRGLEAAIAKKRITAPFAGVLGIRQVEVGQYLEAGDPVVNLQDLAVILANFSVPQRELPRLAVGQRVLLSVDAYPGQPFEGRLAVIEPEVEADTGMASLQATFDNANGLLRPGMYATVAVELGNRRQVVTVPESAVSFTLYGDTAYVVEPRESEADLAEDDAQRTFGAVRQVIVRTGARREGRVVIEEGLEAGQVVVTAGQMKLDDGAAVEVVQTLALTPPDSLPLD